MITIAKLEMDGQIWHAYRAREGSPLRLSISAWGTPHFDAAVPPLLMAAVGALLSRAADGHA